MQTEGNLDVSNSDTISIYSRTFSMFKLVTFNTLQLWQKPSVIGNLNDGL